MKCVCILLAVFSAVAFVGGFPDGAPVEACIYKNFPNHPGTKSLNPKTSPYHFSASSASYGPGSTIKVRINGPPFKGFFIQARADGPQGKWIGQFVETSYAKTHHECSAITHTDPAPKKEVVVSWRAPFDHSGKVVFLATIMQKYDVYWANVINTVEGPAPHIPFPHGPLPPF